MKVHHSLNKSANAKNPSPEFANYLKNASELSYKENSQPRQTLKPKENKGEVKKENTKKTRIIEGDFSRIACSYVLEGNELRKQEAYEDTLAKKTKKQDPNTTNTKGKDKQNLSKDCSTQDRKQILKLEYLQKMGFLRPEQQQMLAGFRKKYGKESTQKKEKPEEVIAYQDGYHKNERVLHPQNKTLKPYPENVNSAYQQVPFYSPKYAETKKISQFFSPNKGGNHYPYQHSYGYGGHHY